MTAYVITGDCNIRQLGSLSPSGSASARAGGDTVDTNGFTFTIDQDCRTFSTSTTFGNLTINAAKGGDINIDGRYVRLIPFTGGSGTITRGATITCGSATGVVIGIYSSMTTAPVVTGVATGWIKVTAWNSVAFPTSGTYTQAGYTFTISGADTAGFIEINGDDAANVVANRLGTFRVTGEWFVLGTTSGVGNQTMQIPNNGVSRYCPGVFIEKTSGQADYEFWPNAGTASVIGTEEARGKVVFITATGQVTIANGSGYTPVSGLAVVVPNIFFECNTTAARTANVIPNATIATRYDFNCTGGGVVEIDKACMNWYLSASQAYSCNVSDSCFMDGILLSEVAAPMTFTRVGVGNKPTTSLAMSPLTMSLCFAGGTFTDCVWQRVSMAASGAHTVSLTDIAGFTFVRDTIRANTIRGNATTYSINALRAIDCTWTNPTIVQGAMAFTTCSGITVTDTVYCEAVSGTTVTTYVGYVWYVASSTTNCVFSGLTMPVTNTQPYTALFYAAAAGCSNIKVRNIGTRAAPLDMGTTNACGYSVQLATSAAASNIKFQRIYTFNTRSGFTTADNSSYLITTENCAGDYADSSVVYTLNSITRTCGYIGSYGAVLSCYGTHWRDLFNSLTAGRLVILMNEPTAATASQVTLTGGAAFTSAGSLYMPTVGQTATFELPYYAIGHTGFSNTTLVMAGGTGTNYNYNYAIDKNDGAGWSAMTTANYTPTTLGAALAAISGIDASKGFKLRLKITTIVANTTAMTSVYVVTTSSAEAQDYQYPLDVNTVTFTGLPSGTDMVVLSAGTTTILQQTDSASAWSYTYSGAQNVDVGFIKPGYVPYYIRNLALGTSDASLPVSLTTDRNYGA